MPTTYMSICAQAGNLGDLVIRRNCLQELTARDAGPVALYTGDMTTDYVNFFAIDDSRVTKQNSNVGFVSALLKDLARGNATVVMAPAPFVAGVSAKKDLKHQVLTAMLWAGKKIGNRVVVFGRAVRGSSSAGIAAERRLARTADSYMTRDVVTQKLLGDDRPISEGPDMAFYQAPVMPEQPKTKVAISLRFDRPLDESRLAWVVSQVREAGYEPMFVTQVRMDGAQHAALASKFDVTHVDWPETRSYSDQLDVVMDAYAQSAGVVSDRLHALIFGMLRSAVPVVWLNPGDSKLLPTLQVITEPEVVSAAGDGADKEFPQIGPAQQQRTYAESLKAHEVLLQRLSDR